MRTPFVALLALLLFLPVVASAESFDVQVTGVRPVSAEYELDGHADQAPSVITDGGGTWMATWRGLAFRGCAKDPNLLSRSTDGGVSWKAPRWLDLLPSRSLAVPTAPSIATDGAGTWLVVWEASRSLELFAETEAFFSRSTDDGATWTIPALVNTDAAFDGRDDHDPRVATDGAGTWAVVWTRRHIGSENDVYISRSFDAGATWSMPAFLNNDGPTDNESDFRAQIATDGSGVWLAMWSTWESGNPSSVNIAYARSTDAGATWTDRQLLTTGGGSYSFSVVHDGVGHWMIAWSANSSPLGNGTDFDVFVSRSDNGGLVWEPPQPVNPNSQGDSSYDARPAVAADGTGNWVVVWETDDDVGGTIGSDWDLKASHSTDLGLTWSDPLVLNSDAATDAGNDSSPALATDRRGNWIAVWRGGDLAATSHAAFRVPFADSCAADGDGDGFGAPGDPSCPLGDALDCDDADVATAPGVPQYCDGLNNDCGHPSWPLLLAVQAIGARSAGSCACRPVRSGVFWGSGGGWVDISRYRTLRYSGCWPKTRFILTIHRTLSCTASLTRRPPA